MPEFVGPFTRSAYLVNKKESISSKFELLRLFIYLPLLPAFKYPLFARLSSLFDVQKRGLSCPNRGHGGGVR